MRHAPNQEVLSDPRVAGYILDAIHDGVMVTDADNRIIAVNRAFTEVTGYRPEEIIGRGPAVLKSGRHGTAFYRTMWRAIEETGHWQGDIWDRRKDGEVYLEHLSIAAIRDDAGRVIRHVGVFRPISTPSPSFPTAPCSRNGCARPASTPSATINCWR